MAQKSKATAHSHGCVVWTRWRASTWNDHAEFGRQQLNRLLLVIIAQVVNGTVQWRVKSGARKVRGSASANPSEIIRAQNVAARLPQREQRRRQSITSNAQIV